MTPSADGLPAPALDALAAALPTGGLLTTPEELAPYE